MIRVVHVACPYCAVEPGELCVGARTGREIKAPHAARVTYGEVISQRPVRTARKPKRWPCMICRRPILAGERFHDHSMPAHESCVACDTRSTT